MRGWGGVCPSAQVRRWDLLQKHPWLQAAESGFLPGSNYKQIVPTQAARKAKRAEEKRRRLETPEIRAAREAREELEKCSAERDEECIYADLARRLDLRERYWTAFETWVRCQRVVEQMKCDKKLRLAVGPDVQI